MFRLLVIPHHYFQRIAYSGSANRVFLHPMLYRHDALPTPNPMKFNRKTRSSAPLDKPYISVIDNDELRGRNKHDYQD